MKLGITTKAFLAVLLVALAVLLAMGVAGRWSFTRGFVGYMDELALQRVENVTPKFVNAYAREGSWDFLRNNRRVWFHLTRPHGGEDDPQRPGEGRGGRDLPLDALPESDLTGAVFRLSLIDAEQRFVMGNSRIGIGRAHV